MANKLTIRQEKFCRAYVETGNASEAYRRAYNADGMKAETIHRNAKALLDNNKVATMVNELKADHAERHRLTVDDLIAELEEARTLSREIVQPATMVTATMGKAKILSIGGENHNLTIKPLPASIDEFV